MRARIRERLKATGKTQKEASLHIGMNDAYVNNFLNGEKGGYGSQSFKFELLPKLAEFLECDPRYLTGEALKPDGTGNEMIETRRVIASKGIAKRDMDQPISIHADDRFPAELQEAFLVMGDDWKQYGINDGSIIIARKAEPAEGDIVVYQNSDDGAGITKFPIEVKATQGEGRVEEPSQDDSPSSAKLDVIGIVTMELRMF
ncbi:hypothetical protein GCM10017322_22870 [Paracoccus aerius]|nr:hypothetical protein GCM10017322_22870 [Paracoccus aerius]